MDLKDIRFEVLDWMQVPEDSDPYEHNSVSSGSIKDSV